MKNKRNLLLLFVLSFALILSACDKKETAKEESQSDKQETAQEESKDNSSEDTSNQEEENNSTDESNSDESQAEQIVIKMGAPKAPPVIPVLKMIEDKAMGENIDIQIDFWESPEQLIAMIQEGNHDMYAFPLTVIAKLHNKGMPVKLTNVNTWGVAYLMTKDENVKSWEDLAGKQLYVPLQTSPVDVMSQYFLNEAGVKDSVEIIYGSKTELAQMMMTGKVEYGVMLEPLVSAVTMKNPDMKVISSFQDDWNKLGREGMIPTAGIGTTDKFAENNHDLVVKFEEEYAKALEFMKTNPEEAGRIAEEQIGMKKPIIMKAIPNMGLNYKSAVDSKAELDEYYQLLFDFDPKTIGGKIPSDEMYFK